VQKSLDFAANLKALVKKGLRSDLVQQIAAAGVEEGGATAQALASATKGQIAEMNKLQKNMQGAAKGVGGAVADSMYGAGIKSAQGLVKGLESQEKKIEAQMMRIAKAMQKAIKKALGIHSPSRVFHDIGVFIPQGLAQGITGGTHHATTAAHRLAASVTAAGTPASPRTAMAGGHTVYHQHLIFNIEGNVTTVDRLSKDVEKAFLRRGMRNPLTYPAYTR
jgi:hypothetical protein